MPSKNDQDASPDLIESIDSLLVQVEETTKAYTPQEDQTVNTNMMITDDGTIAVPAEPVVNDESVEPEASEEADPIEPIDSIENAQQALDAIDEVEIQAEDLVAQSIDALLDEAESAVESDPVEAPVDSIAESETEPETEPVVEPVAETEVKTEVEAEVVAEPETETEAEAESEAESEAEETQPATQPQSQDDEILSDSIGDLLNADTPPIENSQDEPSAIENSMDLLDDALAHAADDMLEGDFETEDGELVCGESVTSAIEKALEEDSNKTPPQENAPDDLSDQAKEASATPETSPETSASASTSKPTTEKTAKADPAAVAQPATAKAAQTTNKDHQESTDAPESEEEAAQPLMVPAWFERAIEIARPPIDKIDPFKGKSMDVIAVALGSLIVMTLTHARPAAARCLILVSKPLSKQPVEIRNAIGYIALWTGFLATVVWIYLLVFKTPHIPEPTKEPTRVFNAEDVMQLNGMPGQPLPSRP